MRRMTRLLLPALFALLVVGFDAGSAVARGSGLTVEVNQSRRVVLGGAIANVIVGDPTVADVVMVDAHSVIVVGKGFGVTQVMVIDRAGHALLDSRVTVVAPNAGRVTVYRGAAGTDYSCAGRCQVVAAPGGAAAGAPAPAAAAAPAAVSPQSLPGAP
jgi:hypothetical protein